MRAGPETASVTAEHPSQDLSFDRVDPTYRAFIEDYLRLHGIDPITFCKPLPGADEMFFNAILPNYEFDASISAFNSSQGLGAAMAEVARAQQITARAKRFMVGLP